VRTKTFSDLADRVRRYGIAVNVEHLPVETPGRFDGPSITVNSSHQLLEQCYHLAHAFGSIVAWSVDLSGATRVFNELRLAKREDDDQRLERALAAFAQFEETASRYAVWFLEDAGHGKLIGSYTEFFRADLEAMRVFHREGVAPVWPEFFAAWKQSVAEGTITVKPYSPLPVPPFVPVRIPAQEVVQEHDGKP
jgi:hypothetical protein